MRVCCCSCSGGGAVGFSRFFPSSPRHGDILSLECYFLLICTSSQVVCCWAFLESKSLQSPVIVVRGFRTVSCHVWWGRDSSVVECQTPDQKVVGLIPGRIIVFSRVNFYVLTLILVSVPSPYYCTHKRSRSFCQKCWWQVRAEHTCTLHLWLSAELNWCMIVRCAQNVQWFASSFTWHQPCNSQPVL